MERVVPYLPNDLAEPESIVGPIRARRGGRLLNLDRMLLHSPRLAFGWSAFFGVLRRSGQSGIEVSAALKEMCICFVGILNDAEYEVYQHEPVFRSAGGTAEQVQALRDLGTACATGPPSAFSEEAAERSLKRDCIQRFDPLELDALDLAYHMSRTIKVPKPLMLRLRERLGHQRLVELVTAVGAYNGVSRILVALDVTAEGEEPPKGEDGFMWGAH